ncbi:hypothetical protein ABZ319_04135 [Nocardia sp. NPDC005978]|uniref:hypothetical protein n=1 Tax=Nocardia sp. NPDC005978 TaxID=3156725 RepID=UPI0033AB5A0F
MAAVIKVFTPVKRVPIMIGKAQNGQKLPFGPYTLPQIAGGAALLLATSLCALTFPVNAAVTFITGLCFTVVVVFALGLVPYTGVRLISRAWWIARLLVARRPVSASGVPITTDSNPHLVLIDQTVVLLLPDASRTQPSTPRFAAAGNYSATRSAAAEISWLGGDPASPSDRN